MDVFLNTETYVCRDFLALKALVLSIIFLLQAIKKWKALFLSVDIYQNSKKKKKKEKIKFSFLEQAFITYKCE